MWVDFKIFNLIANNSMWNGVESFTKVKWEDSNTVRFLIQGVQPVMLTFDHDKSHNNEHLRWYETSFLRVDIQT